MRFFIRWALVYFLVATALNFLLRQDASVTGLTFLGLTVNVFSVFKIAFPITAAILIGSWFASSDPKDFVRRLANGFLTLVVCCLFLSGFSSVKTLLPLLAEALGQTPFFADPLFAALDRAIHFGVDPWRFAHAATEAVGWTDFVHHSALAYGLWWAIPAFYLPAIMVLLGDGEARQRHYLVLYFFCWILLGNILALVGLSAGPVYYDRLFGTEMYVDLNERLAAAGIAGSWFGDVQEKLWLAFAEQQQAIGSGISAFPSLHVAMATVTALYLGEKHRFLGLIGWAFFAAVLFVSVWIGYHYAIDGYFSVAAVLALHWALKRGFLRNLVTSDRNDAPSQLTPRAPAE
ncbi:hypothetical protein GQ651_15645 [Alphaproteobacteria bacterium GH1-50]|uniref:Inositolphosphotransferase Aur1/Ipt1 domain-containing protein n=1 Tax=Kangsaoukella pontilimi TaxID=2691042 RepID=A0A7C9N2C1_9RHOB|nr:phosphatase PAP2 family protein [Kangsaoukella pontilimi]MXQ09278.1 hypothetical protein [Kangsaoukella pontilimi]